MRTTAAANEGKPFIDLRFEGNRVEGDRLLLPLNGSPSNQVAVKMSLELPDPVYDWRWWGLLIAALPLEPDFARQFLAFASESDVGSPLIIITARVSGSENVGNIPCWVVNVDAGVPWTLWIARIHTAAPVQRIQIDQPDGSRLMWDPL